MINSPLSSDWFERHKRSRQQKVPPLINTAMTDFLMPTSMDYDTPVVSTYSSLIPNLDFFNGEEKWILRDGLIPLAWFFRINEKPKGLKTKIYVHKKHVNFVPKSWRPIIGTYEQFGLPGQRKRKNLGLVGILSDNYISGTYSAKVIRSVSRSFNGQDVKSLKKFCHLPTRDPYGPYRAEVAPHTIDTVLLLGKQFGADIKSLSVNQMLGIINPEDWYFVDINDQLLNSDNGLIHYLISRGGALWRGRKKVNKLASNEELLWISERHGFVLDNQPEFSEEKPTEFGEINEMMKLFNEPANQNFPWPDIFSDWAHNLVNPNED